MNGSPAVVVGGLRTQIAKLIAEHHQIKLAPAPLDDAKRQVRELVARLGAKGKPTIRTQFGELHVHGWQSAEQFGPTFHDIDNCHAMLADTGYGDRQTRRGDGGIAAQ